MSSERFDTEAQVNQLPLDGFIRLKQLLPFIGIKTSTVWKWVQQGRFPQPLRFGSRCTMWRCEDIRKWMKEAA